MTNGNVVLDKYFNIVSGSPDFFKFVGVKNFESLLKLVHPHDVDKLKEASDLLEKVGQNSVMIKMRNTEGEYREMYAVLYKTNYVSEGVPCFGMDLNDVLKSLEEIKCIKNENLILRSLFEKHNSIVFSYNKGTGLFHMFSVGKNRNFDVFKGSLDDWYKECLDFGSVDIRSRGAFDQMIADIKSCNSFEYDIYLSPKSDISTFGLYKFNGRMDHTAIEGKRILGEMTAASRGAIDAISQYSRDPMTGLLDKPSIIKYAKDMIAESELSGEKIVLAMVDMDDFKAVNDNLGHKMGDNVLIRFSEILSETIGLHGAAGRYGGDEFLIVFTNFKGYMELRSFLRAIRTTVQMEFKNINGSSCSVTCSIGCAEYPSDGRNYDEVFSVTDTCVYIAKEYGKNRYIIYDDKVKSAINTDENLWEGRSNRVAKNNDFIFNMTSKLFNDGETAIPDVLKDLGINFNLAHVKVYKGEDVKLAYSWMKEGEGEAGADEHADYIFEAGYLDRFNINNILRIDNVSKLEMRYPTAFKTFKKYGVNSAVQYIVKKNDKPFGLISFELSPPATRYWHEAEVNTFALVSQLIGQLIVR